VILIKKIPHISLLPKSLKVDYCRASEAAENGGYLHYFLWEAITPGWTAVFLILTAIWYYWKGRNARDVSDFGGEKAYNDAANAILLWGILNSCVYASIVFTQKSKLKFF